MWDVIQNVGTPISLIAFVAAIISYAFLGSQKNKIEVLKTLPEDRRWEILNKNLENYNISEDNLTRDQKFELMKTVLMQKAEHKKRIIYIFFSIFLILFIIASSGAIVSYLYHTNLTSPSTISLNKVFGETSLGKARVQAIPTSENHSKLNKSFISAKSEIRIVTELGNTWLLSENYQSLLDALSRNVNVKLLTFDFTNKELRNIAKYSSQKGEDKKGYTPKEVLRGFKEYKNLLENNHNFSFSSYTHYPWVRFTLFDDSVVSFVLRPMLNISKPQPFYSTDPVIIKMFEAIFLEFQKTEKIYKNGNEFNYYIEKYKDSIKTVQL